MAEEMGFVGKCETIEIGSDRCTVFQQVDNEHVAKTVTVVLRGGTQNSLDDLERAVDDAVNTVKMMTKDSRLVPGAGATEMALAHRLVELGEKTPGVKALGVKAFGEALEVIPRVLAENAGLDATGVISILYAAHSKGKDTVGVNVDAEITSHVGISLDQSVTQNEANLVTKDVIAEESHPYKVFDSLSAKSWALKYAVEACLTVLRVDQIIMAKPAGGPKMPKGGNSQLDEDQMA